MKYAHPDVCCPSFDDGGAAETDAPPRRDLPGTRWRAALAALASAPVRLHRYRNFHAEVVEDAIRAYDCRKTCEDKQ